MSEPLPFPPLPKPPLVSEAVAEAAEINVKAYADLVRAEARAALLAELRAKVEALPVASGSHMDQCWSDAVGAYETWHECSTDGVTRAAVLALLDDPS